MQAFTLINLMLELELTVKGNSRMHCRMKAVDIAKAQGYTTGDNSTAYWVVKQDYYNTAGFKVLSV